MAPLLHRAAIIIGAHFQTFFSTIFLFLTLLNIHIYFIILKTYDQQFTLTTKKSLHIIFKTNLSRKLLSVCRRKGSSSIRSLVTYEERMIYCPG